MIRGSRLLFPVAGLALALCAAFVSVRAWRGERALEAGREAQSGGDLNRAVFAFARAAALGNAEAAVESARLLVLLGDVERADAALRVAMALSPARGTPHLLRAQLELSRPGPWDALREERLLAGCRTAVSLEPARPAIWRDCAVAALGLAARRRAAWDPARARVVLDGAVQDGGEAIARQPDAARTTLEALLDAGAGPAFLAETATAGGGQAALAAAVELLLARRLWAGAEQEYWARAESRGLLSLHAAAAATALARRKLPREALAAARRGLRAAPGDGALAALAAESAAQLPGEEGLEAIALFRSALAADPANGGLRRRFASFLAGRALLAEAEAEVRAALDGNPRDADAWFLLGEILRRGGRPQAAGEAYARAAALRPAHAGYRRAAAGSRRPD